MKLVTINLNTAPTTGQNYTYRLRITKYDGGTVYIHYGKFFASANQRTVTLDLEDILWNYRYQAQQTFKPVVSTENQQYSMPYLGRAAVLSDYWYNTVQIVDTEATPRFTSDPCTFFFVPVQTAGYKGVELPANGVYVPVLDSVATPHIPSNPPAGFNWSVMVYGVQSATVKALKDGTQLSSTAVSAGKAYAIPLTGAEGEYKLQSGNTDLGTVAVVDQCNKPYYLIWLSNNGGMQCQGFLKSSEFSVKYDTHSRVDMHNHEWKVGSVETASWKLKSNTLSDAEYKAYGEMFNSPAVALLDMENGRLHYVNIKTSDYKEKRRTRNSTKPFFFEVEVTACEHLKV